MVAIKDMEMPKNCVECKLFHFYLDLDCVIHYICKCGNIEMCGDLKNKRSGICPLATIENEEDELKQWEYDKGYDRGYEDAMTILDKIRAEIEKQEKWLLQTGYDTYNVDIAFSSIKLVLWLNMNIKGKKQILAELKSEARE